MLVLVMLLGMIKFNAILLHVLTDICKVERNNIPLCKF